MGLIDFVIDLAERSTMERQRVKVGMDDMDKTRHETEVEIRKIAIAKLYPNDYKEHRDLSDPLSCMFITESFKKNEKQCADKGGEDILCNIRRRKYSRCEAIRKEVEKMRNPIATAKLEVEKYKRAVIAKAEAEGEL